MTQLTANFSLHELTKSETALRLDMPNEPGPTEIANLTTLAGEVLQKVRDHYGKGVKVNSGFRHPEVNAKVGGSRHRTTARARLLTSRSLACQTTSWPSTLPRTTSSRR